MIAIIFAFIDVNPFGCCFMGVLKGRWFLLNLIVSVMMIVQVIATIFSGFEYLKNGKDLFKDC